MSLEKEFPKTGIRHFDEPHPAGVIVECHHPHRHCKKEGDGCNKCPHCGINIKIFFYDSHVPHCLEKKS